MTSKYRVQWSLPLEVIELVRKRAEEEKAPEAEVAAKLLRHGELRFQEVVEQERPTKLRK